MGEVYRARDPRMNREVAVKVLPESVAANRERLARFEQEARAAGMLNHPNLLTVYDVGAHDSVPYLVAEFLEGETLRQKLNAGSTMRSGDSSSPLPMRKAIEWAQQLAAGLSAAHEKGIVHRDLKPENIFITRDGRVKILDFGLAKLTAEANADVSSLTDARTQQRGTDPGTVLGTVGYMSPEQVRAQPLDHRSDIFSFGAILYEMFAGVRAFRGDSTADTMSAILHEDPPELSTTNPNVPPGVERIVRHCLEKSPDERFQSARDLAFDLASLSTDSARVAPAKATRRVALPLVSSIALASLLTGFIAGWFVHTPRVKPATTPRARPLTYSGRDASPAVSPDHRSIIFSSGRDGRRRLWLKELATGGEVPLTTGLDDFPRYSPDGSTIIFIRTENGVPALYRTAVVAGTPRRLLARVVAADFTPDGKQIVYVPYDDASSIRSSVAIANADGSNPRVITSVPRIMGTPRVSPDGKWIALADLTSGNLGNRAWLMSIDGKVVRPLPLPRGYGSAGGVTWSDAQHVIYGAPESIAGYSAGAQQTFFSVDLRNDEVKPLINAVGGLLVEKAGPGKLIFDTFAFRQNLREIPLDGKSEARWLSRGSAMDRQPAYSRDGQWIAFSSNRSGNLDVWAVNRESGAVVRLTDDANEDWDPGYTPDGHLIWTSNRSGTFEIWLAESDGSGARQLTHDGVDAENATVTRDGRWVVYSSYNTQNPGVCVMPMSGGTARLLYRGAVELPEVSPDGRWVSFHAIGPNHLMVAEIATGKQYTLAVLTAREVGAAIGRSRWRADGKAVVYVDRDDSGEWSLQQQEFVPGVDTASTRKLLAKSEAPTLIESFGMSPDGKYVVASVTERVDGVYIAENVPTE